MFLRTTCSKPRSYHDDWKSSMTLVPARRARSMASRCQKTKLMSTRSGLVGSSSTGPPPPRPTPHGSGGGPLVLVPPPERPIGVERPVGRAEDRRHPKAGIGHHLLG